MGLVAPGLCLAQVSGNIVPVHDPCIIKSGSFYYLFCTGWGIPIRKSKDLHEWEGMGKVFPTEPHAPKWTFERVPHFKGWIWAPDIHYYNGRFILFYAVSTWGSNQSCIGLVVNETLDPTDPNYRWVDQGMVIQSKPGKDNWNAIDSNFVLDRDGNPWLTFGSFWGGIQLTKLDSKTLKPERDPPRTIPIASRSGIGPNAIEAPFILWKDGYYYLFFSVDHCCRGTDSTYKIMVGRSKAIDGPYKDRMGRPLLMGGETLVLASHGNFHGPGHNAVLVEGTSYWLVHHMYDAGNNGARTLQIRPMIWAQDGWPLAGEPISRHQSSGTFGPKDMEGTWDHSFNFQDPIRILLLPNGKISDPSGKASWSLKDRWFTLRWPRAEVIGGVWVDECYVADDGTSYIGRNQADMVIRGIRPPREK